MMRWYEDALTRFTVPITRHFVETCCGRTHVLTSGEPTAPPLVLLHGINVNAIGWRQQFGLLAGHFHLIAPDVIGCSGLSAPTRPAYTDDGHTRWLLDVLNNFNIARAGIVASSAGGWNALKLAVLHPQRVAGLVLINPLGIMRLRYPLDFFRHPLMCAAIGELGRRVMPTRAAARRLVRASASRGVLLDADTVEMAYLLLRYFRRRPPPPALRAHELKRVRAPLTLLVGERDPYLNARRLVRVAQRHMPQVEAHLFAEGGHDLHNDRAQEVADIILRTQRRISLNVEIVYNTPQLKA